MQLSVPQTDISQSFQMFNGKFCRTNQTLGDGACGIHSVFGSCTGNFYFRQNARAFLLDKFTMSASTFKSRLNDVSTLSDMSQVLWKELVKPCAAKQAGIPRYEMKVKPEGSLVWQEIMKHPSLADNASTLWSKKMHPVLHLRLNDFELQVFSSNSACALWNMCSFGHCCYL